MRIFREQNKLDFVKNLTPQLFTGSVHYSYCLMRRIVVHDNMLYFINPFFKGLKNERNGQGYQVARGFNDSVLIPENAVTFDHNLTD